MPRSILSANSKIEPIETNSDKVSKSGYITDRILLQKRSGKYLDTINKLDINNLTRTNGFDELLDQIKEEFRTADIADILLGIVAQCFLGEDFEVHTLDFTASEIISHYRRGENLPLDLEKARNLALHPSYIFIEVYKDKIICIRDDGTAVKL